MAHEIKNSKYGWIQVLKFFTKNLFITLSQLYLHLKMTSFSGSFITGTKKSLTPPAFISLLRGLQRSVLNVRAKIYLGSNAGL